MMSENKILIGSFLLLSVVISLFPPFSWGDEKLRTISERQTIHYYLEDKIPVKEYDFLFNDLKKEFIFSNSKVILERHLIISELLIEIFIALLISIFIQFIYYLFSHRVLFFGFYFLSIILALVLSLFLINKTASWFQPDYSNISAMESKIRSDYLNLLEKMIRQDYVRLIRDNSIAEVSRIIENLKKGFRKDWDEPTNQLWDALYSEIELKTNQYPKVTDFLHKEVKEKKIKSLRRFDFSSFGKYRAKEDKEFAIDNYDVYAYYSPPNGYSVDYSEILRRIDSVKYNILMDTLKNYPTYLPVLAEYRESINNYWTETIPKIKLFTAVGMIIIISLVFYLKKEWLMSRIKMYNPRLLMNQQ